MVMYLNLLLFLEREFSQSYVWEVFILSPQTQMIPFIFHWLQETALNHVKTAGLLGDGFGATPEMSKRNLIWVVTRMQILVDRYPTW